MTADKQHALAGLLFQGGDRPLLDILQGEGLLAFSPDLDPFKQGAALIPARLASSQGGVQMNVGLHKGGTDELLLNIERDFR